MRRSVSWFACLIAVVSCTDDRLPVEPPPSLQIQDATHNGGNRHFFWLPPLVRLASFTGTFDGSLSPVVEICEWNGSACANSPIANFTMTSGTGSEIVRLEPADEDYTVNWHTDRFDLDPSRTYRIRVLISGTELGHADVDVVSSGSQLKNVATGEFVPLLDGRTLPIKFRIESGAFTGTATVLTTSPNPAAVGDYVTLTATVTAADGRTPGTNGVVIFSSNGQPLQGSSGVPLTNGVATWQTSLLPMGSDPIIATYSGAATFGGSQSNTVTQVINRVATTTALTTSPNPAGVGDYVTLTATVTAADGRTPGTNGVVTFSSNGQPLQGSSGVPLTNGVATWQTSLLPVGSHPIIATYSGDATLAGSESSPVTQVIAQVATTTVLTTSPNPAAVGDYVTLTATVTATDGSTPGTNGVVIFSSDGQPLQGSSGVPLTNGVATWQTSLLPVGSHSIIATYSGDANSGGSQSGTVTQVINRVATTTALATTPNPAAVGDYVTLTATVTAADGSTPGTNGVVIFSSNGQSLQGSSGVPLTNGVATWQTSLLPVGSHPIIATYSGDATFAGSASSPVTQIITQVATTTLTLTPSPLDFGTAGPYSVTLHLTVTNTGGISTFAQLPVLSGNVEDFEFEPFNSTCSTRSSTNLAAGASCTYGITFIPSATGLRQATVSINASNASTVSAVLTGIGAPTTLSVTPGALNFGTVGPYTTTLYLTVTNTGGASTLVNLPVVTGNVEDFRFLPYDAVNVTCPILSKAQLNPGASCSFGITFIPSATGPRQATVTISAFNANTLSATLTGTGASTTLSVSPTAPDFGNVTVGVFSGLQSVTVTNTGGASTLVNIPVLTGNTDDFVSALLGTGATCGTNSKPLLAPGASCTFGFYFVPTTTGLRQATLAIGAYNANTIPVTLTGTGVAGQ